jgi:hypothetical protein
MKKPNYNNKFGSNSKQTRIEIDFANLPVDSHLIRKFSEYHPNIN